MELRLEQIAFEYNEFEQTYDMVMILMGSLRSLLNTTKNFQKIFEQDRNLILTDMREIEKIIEDYSSLKGEKYETTI